MKRLRNQNRDGRELRLSSLLATVGLGSAFLGAASFVSVMAPVHRLSLQRQAAHQVQAEVSQRLLLFIAIRSQVMAQVNGVKTRTYSAPSYTRPAEDHEPRGPVEVHPEDQGFLVLEGEGGRWEIATSPVDLEEDQRRVEEFLKGSDRSLKLWMISNWKFGVLATVAVAALGCLLWLGAAWDVVIWSVARRRPRQAL
jgi:type IV secretory pathway TrbD component